MMDNFGLPDRLCEMDESDFPNILEDEIFDPTKLDSYDASPEWLDLFDDPVLNDRMISEAMTTPHIKSEHSYSLAKNGKLTLTNTTQALEDEPEHAPHCINPMLLEDASAALQLTQQFQPASQQLSNITAHQPAATQINNTNNTALLAASNVKPEPKVIVQAEPLVFETRRSTQQQSLLRQNAIVLTTQVVPKQPEKIVMPHMIPKVEPMDDDDLYYGDDMPMTPPSSSSSDSEGGQSPRQSPPPSPCRQVLITNKTHHHHRQMNPATAIFSQPIPTSGVLVLTEEEKRTLISEGYPVPSKLPLSKHEEKNLKKVRRKIKNKISAQESRRKKKEYLDQLEKKVEDVAKENNDLRKKCENYESSNRSLISQLAKLQNMLKHYTPHTPQATAQAGTCVMVLILCFAVFLGNWSPISFGSSSTSSVFGYGSSSGGMSQNVYSSSPLVMDGYDTPSMKSSRTLMTMNDETSSSCGNEPWPLMLARRSYECISQLISDYPVVDNTHSVPANVVDSASVTLQQATTDSFNIEA